MKIISKFSLISAVIGLTAFATAAAGPDQAKWNSLLQRYVTSEGRVDYRALKSGRIAELDSYLHEVAAGWPKGMSPSARKAALINAYNALTVRWIVTNYPVASIEKTNDPFKSVRHVVDGQRVSLDQVEAKLRAMKDPRIHAALVCAGKSCPPLRREAYVADRLDAQLDENTRTWLANTGLNEFDPDRKVASISSIFKWYRHDFESAGGLKSFLARYAPQGRGEFLLSTGARMEFKHYDWGLNDTSVPGAK